MIDKIIKESKKVLLSHPAIEAADNAICLQALRSSTKGYEGPSYPDAIEEELRKVYLAGRNDCKHVCHFATPDCDECKEYRDYLAEQFAETKQIEAHL